PNGVLLVNECGLVNGKPRIVVPHPEFRIFFTMNSKFGEISRAMRNRCAEFGIVAPLFDHLDHFHATHHSLETKLSPYKNDLHHQLLIGSGVKSLCFREWMIDVHLALLRHFVRGVSSSTETPVEFTYLSLKHGHAERGSNNAIFQFQRTLLQWGQLLQALIQQNTDTENALRTSFVKITKTEESQKDKDKTENANNEKRYDNVKDILEEFVKRKWSNSQQHTDNSQTTTNPLDKFMDMYFSKKWKYGRQHLLSQCCGLIQLTGDNVQDSIQWRVWIEAIHLSRDTIDQALVQKLALELHPSKQFADIFDFSFQAFQQSSIVQCYVTMLRQLAELLNLKPEIFLNQLFQKKKQYHIIFAVVKKKKKKKNKSLMWQNNDVIYAYVKHCTTQINPDKSTQAKAMLSTVQDVQRLVCVFVRWHLWNMIETQYIQALGTTSEEDISNCTVVQLSHLISTNDRKRKLSERLFSRDLVAWVASIVPFLREWDAWINWLLSSICEQLLHNYGNSSAQVKSIGKYCEEICFLRGRIWLSCTQQMKEFECQNTQMRFRELYKQMDKIFIATGISPKDNANEAFCNLLDSLTHAVVTTTEMSEMTLVGGDGNNDVNTKNRAKNRLYRYGGQGFVSRNVLVAQLYDRLMRLNQIVSFRSQIYWNCGSTDSREALLQPLLQASNSKRGCYLINSEWKHHLVNAISTLQFLQCQFPQVLAHVSFLGQWNEHSNVASAVTLDGKQTMIQDIVQLKQSKHNSNKAGDNRMALELLTTIENAMHYLQQQWEDVQSKYAVHLQKITQKMTIEHTHEDDKFLEVYFDTNEDNVVEKEQQEEQYRNFAESINFSSKLHHVWLYLAPIVSCTFLKGEYTQVLTRYPSLLFKGLSKVNPLHQTTRESDHSSYVNECEDMISDLHGIITQGLLMKSIDPYHVVNLQTMIWTADVMKQQQQQQQQQQHVESEKNEESEKSKRVWLHCLNVMHDEMNNWHQLVTDMFGCGITFLEHLIRHLAKDGLPSGGHSDNAQKSKGHLLSMFGLTLYALQKTYENNKQVELHHALMDNCWRMFQIDANNSQSHSDLWNEDKFDQVISECKDIRWLALKDVLLVPLYRHLLHFQNNDETRTGTDTNDSDHYYYCWVLLGLLRWELLIPARHLDPNAKYNIRLEDCMEQKSHIDIEEELWKRIEMLQTGKTRNYSIDQLQSKKHTLEEYKMDLLGQVTYRSKAKSHHTTFAMFWHELMTFFTHHCSHDIVLHTVQKLQSKDTPKRELAYAFHQLRSFVSLAKDMTSRLNTTFGHFNDFVAPLANAVEMICYGLCGILENYKSQQWLELNEQSQSATRKMTRRWNNKTLIKKTETELMTKSIEMLLSPVSVYADEALLFMQPWLHKMIKEKTEHMMMGKNVHENSTSERDTIVNSKRLSAEMLLSGLDKSVICTLTFPLQNGVRVLSWEDLSTLDQWFTLLAQLYQFQKEREREIKEEQEALYQLIDDKQEATKETKNELFPDYLLDFLHLRASQTLHKKTQMKKDVESLESKLANDPTIREKHASTWSKKMEMEQEESRTDLWWSEKQERELVAENEALQNKTPEQIQKLEQKRQQFKMDDCQYHGEVKLTLADVKHIFEQFLRVFGNETSSHDWMDSMSAHHHVASALVDLYTSNTATDVELDTTNAKDPLSKSNSNDNNNNGNNNKSGDNDNAEQGDSLLSTNIPNQWLEKGADIFGHLSCLANSSQLHDMYTVHQSKKDGQVNMSPVDVYSQMSPAYVRLIQKPLQALSTRIAALLSVYPNHPVLQEISELCMHLGDISIRSPVMKVLTGLELLLSKAQGDWENGCAAKHTSIAAQLEPIYKIIGYWRSLEIRSWSVLFERKERQLAENVMKTWCYLYQLIHSEQISDELIRNFDKQNEQEQKKRFRKYLGHEVSHVMQDEMEDGKNLSSHLSPHELFGVKATEVMAQIANPTPDPETILTEAQKKDKFLHVMFNHLNEFIENSPLGELDLRLQVMEAFHQQLNQELSCGYDERRLSDKQVRVQLLHMIAHLKSFHKQFDSIVEFYKNAMFGPIKQQLKELIKFSKWDLRNYWSLRESANKSHSKLAKLYRDWQIELQ
ncbi:hypothetical protein RFI_06925, partial [Reticulomyxa filosa]